MTRSGPPSSNVRFAAAGRSTRLREVGGDVVDPDRLELLLAVADHGRDRRPAHLPDEELERRRRREPKTKLGRKITCSRPDAFTACSISHFAAVVRHEVLRLLADAERAHQHEAADARVLRRGEQVRVPSTITRSKSAGLPRDDRDEVDDGVAAGHRPPQARRVGDVALGELAAPALQRPARAGLPNEAADVRPGGAQRVDDLRADEARSARDEDHAGSFSSSGSASGPAGPGTSSRARRCRRATPPARTAGRTRAGRSSSRGRS